MLYKADRPTLTNILGAQAKVSRLAGRPPINGDLTTVVELSEDLLFGECVGAALCLRVSLKREEKRGVYLRRRIQFNTYMGSQLPWAPPISPTN